jgi:hypothetical protein
MAPKKRPPVQKEPAPTEVKLIPDPTFELPYPRHYSNHVSIHSTPFDFTLRFCEALPIYEPPKSVRGEIIEVKIPIKAEIVIPKEVFPTLITAMKEHYDKYLKIYDEASEHKKKMG